MTFSVKREGGKVQARSEGQGTGRYTEDPERFQRMAEALEMRIGGATFAEIAGHFGVHYETARRWVLDARKAWPMAQENADEMRERENAKLDRLEKKAWKIIENAPIAWGGSSARIPIDPKTGEPLRDTGKVLSAMDKLIAISRRRAGLNGLDVPVESKASIRVSSELDGDIARYLGSLRAAGEADYVVGALIESLIETAPRAIGAGWNPGRPEEAAEEKSLLAQTRARRSAAGVQH